MCQGKPFSELGSNSFLRLQYKCFPGQLGWHDVLVARDAERGVVGELGDGGRHLGRVLRSHHSSLRRQHAEEQSTQSKGNAHQDGKLCKSIIR